jgi:hypothetical protein
MTLTVQHVRLGNVSDIDGALIFNGDALVGVASRLSAEHRHRAGRWFMECGLGPRLDVLADFTDLDALCIWVQARLDDDHPDGGPADRANVVQFKLR